VGVLAGSEIDIFDLGNVERKAAGAIEPVRLGGVIGRSNQTTNIRLAQWVIPDTSERTHIGHLSNTSSISRSFAVRSSYRGIHYSKRKNDISTETQNVEANPNVHAIVSETTPKTRRAWTTSGHDFADELEGDGPLKMTWYDAR
jgi:hypothetical protein